MNKKIITITLLIICFLISTQVYAVPDTVTLNNPNIDLYVTHVFNSPYNYVRFNSPTVGLYIRSWEININHGYNSYIEWNITSIPDNADISEIQFRYQGLYNSASSFRGKIMSMEGRNSDYADTNAGNGLFFTDMGDGIEFYSANTFPVVAVNEHIHLLPMANDNLEAHLAGNWWAVGLSMDNGINYKRIASENYNGANPIPTLYVEYTLPVIPPSDIIYPQGFPFINLIIVILIFIIMVILFRR